MWLTLDGRTGSTLVGRLVVDPNTCSLNVFGDREACTRIAVWGFDVELQLGTELVPLYVVGARE